MKKVQEVNSVRSSDCYLRKLEGEPHFTFLGRDPDAPEIIRQWALNRVKRLGDNPDWEHALYVAQAFEDWRKEHDGEWRK